MGLKGVTKGVSKEKNKICIPLPWVFLYFRHQLDYWVYSVLTVVLHTLSYTGGILLLVQHRVRGTVRNVVALGFACQQGFVSASPPHVRTILFFHELIDDDAISSRDDTGVHSRALSCSIRTTNTEPLSAELKIIGRVGTTLANVKNLLRA